EPSTTAMSPKSSAQVERTVLAMSAQVRPAEEELGRSAPVLGAANAPAGAVAFDVAPRTRSEVANRVMNVVIASVALLIVSPIMALFALVVRLTSDGPIFYRQV